MTSEGEESKGGDQGKYQHTDGKGGRYDLIVFGKGFVLELDIKLRGIEMSCEGSAQHADHDGCCWRKDTSGANRSKLWLKGNSHVQSKLASW